MKVKHCLDIQAKCPANGATDTYRMTVVVDRLVMVEDILAAVEKVTAEPIYQEHLTVKLAHELGAHVSTSGTHGKVFTECEA